MRRVSAGTRSMAAQSLSRSVDSEVAANPSHAAESYIAPSTVVPTNPAIVTRLSRWRTFNGFAENRDNC
jgi:hypothetical protein